MPRADEHVVRRPWHRHPVAVVLTALLLGLIATGGLVVAATQREDRLANLFVAAFAGSVSAMLLLSLRQDRDPWSLTELDGRPAWRLRLGASRGTAAGVTAVCLVTGTGAAVTAVLVAEVSTAVVWGVIGAFMLAVGVTMALVVVRAPSFTIGVDRLVHDGAGVRVELAWDDVDTIGYAHTGRWSSVRLGASSPAASHVVRRKPTLLTLDRVPPEPGIELRLPLLPDVPRLLALLRELHTGGRPTRDSLLTRGLPHASGRWPD